MKNLKVLQGIKADLGASIVGQCIDVDNKRIYVILEDLIVYDISSPKAQKIEHNLNLTAIIDKIKYEEVILVEYIVEIGSILIALRCGSIIKLAVSSFGQQSGRVYEHDREIASVRLSPNQDLIALADVDNNLSILSPDMIDCLHTTNALSQNDSLHKPVGVGWGSKETQFFGLDGRPSKEKESKYKTILTEIELDQASRIEGCELFQDFKSRRERSTIVDWRGDGQLLASLTYIKETDKHYIKVWNRNLELQYMSEQLVTMERGIINWIPNGQYICCAQRRDKHINEVVMFEKNGMVHQRITLPSQMKTVHVKELSWSSDSNALAIVGIEFVIDPANATIQRRYVLLIYTMQNFHYYLKYCEYISQLSTDKCEIYSHRWNPTAPNVLYVWSSKGQCYQYEYANMTDYSRGDSLVVVQDANKLLLTPFSICNIPPPMCAVQLEFSKVISKIVIDPEYDYSFYLFTLDNVLIYTDDSIIDGAAPIIKVTQAIDGVADKLPKFSQINVPNSNSYQNLTILRNGVLLASRYRNGINELILLEISKSNLELSERVVATTGERMVKAILRHPKHDSSDKVCFITDDWACSELNIIDGSTKTKFELQKHLSVKVQLLDARFIDESSPTGHILVSLSQDMTLRADTYTLISNLCNSFRLTENFLIFTTIENTLNIVPIKSVLKKLGQEAFSCWLQPIEIGGTLVVASEHDSKVVLQMPRGNLEILHPRILVLFQMIKLLDLEQYAQAMKLARRHRVDSNFICDYLLRKKSNDDLITKLDRFSKHVADCNPSMLNIFITELSSEDTMNSRYKEAMDAIGDLADLSIDRAMQVDDKVNRICHSFDFDHEARFLQPRLLSLLKQTPRRAGEALRTIKEELEQGEQDAALKFLLYFVSIEQLFVDALSTYDTDIALMVAGVSNKDPKEYLALLDNFNSIKDDSLRCYKIDLHMKDYERSLEHGLGHFRFLINERPDDQSKRDFGKELLGLIAEKRLFKTAIAYCASHLSPTESDIEIDLVELVLEILTKYGDYLLTKRYYLEASLVFEAASRFATSHEVRLDRLNNAIKCIMLEDDWERGVAILCRHAATLGTCQVDWLTKLSDNLMLQGKVFESTLVANIPKSEELAMKLVHKGRWFLAEAVGPQKSGTEMEQSVQNEIERVLGATREEFDLAETRYNQLKEVISQPAQPNSRSAFGPMDADNCLLADSLSTVDGSELSSTISGSKLGRGNRVARSGAASIKTRASSSKSSKSKGERKKKIQLKKGSRFEDMALVLELKKFVNEQKGLQESARHLHAAKIYFSPVVGVTMKDDCPMNELNCLVRQSYELAKEICKNLWPRSQDAQEESVYSVYKRFVKRLEYEELFENVDFEVLLAPELPKVVNLLEL